MRHFRFPKVSQLSWMRAIACASVLSLTIASPLARAAPPTGVQNYTFAFQDADITQAIQEVLGQVGIPYSVDPGIGGKLTFRIEQRLNRDQLLAAFEAVLLANGIVIVRNGDQLMVTPQAKAKSAAAIREGGEVGRSPGYQIVAVPLSYAQPSEVAKALAAITSDNMVVYQSDELGLLLLGGGNTELNAALQTLKIFDQSAFAESKIRWFELSQAQAITVAGELDRIVQGAGLVGTAIVPLKRLNGVIVFGRSTDELDEISRWVARLDTPGKETAASLWFYRPRAASAEALARTLSQTMGFQSSVEAGSVTRTDAGRARASDAAPAQPSSAETVVSLGGANSDEPVRIGADKDTNTLIVSASSGKWVQIQRILAEIDRSPRQVLIEASILEVTLGKSFQFGVDWSILEKNFSIGAINTGAGAVAQSFPGFSAIYLKDDIQASIQALGSRTAVEVISAPKIIALDNKTAHLEVGDQVPVVSQSAQSQSAPGAPVVNSVDYRSTGVILNVTPRVTGDGQLILEVSQEASSVARTVTSGIDSPTIQQRRFESTLLLRDGGVVALGGLIGTTRNRGNSGVPFLKDIPGVGGLFSSRSQDFSRTELIVLLKARIIPDAPTERAVMQDLFKDLRELQARGLIPAG